MSADEVVKFLIEKFLVYVDDLKDYQDVEGEEFQFGERVAYTECLEYLQMWIHAAEYGLDFDVEERYPLDKPKKRKRKAKIKTTK